MREWIMGKPLRVEFLRRFLDPDSGTLGQGMRFIVVGALAALIYLSTTTLLALVVGIPFQVALTIGFLLTIIFHFTMQRVFVWANRDGFSLPFHHQAGRYLVLAAAQYGVTSATTALLPAALGLPTEVVYVATVVFIAVVNFVVFRYRVFHPKVSIVHSEGEPREAVVGTSTEG
jgi:putative flippase GtrA